MKVKELMKILKSVNPESEVLTQVYNGSKELLVQAGVEVVSSGNSISGFNGSAVGFVDKSGKPKVDIILIRNQD